MSNMKSSWQLFHCFVVSHYLKYGFSQDEASKTADQYNFWQAFGIDYEELREGFEEVFQASDRQSEYANSDFVQNLTSYLRTRRLDLENEVSVTNAVYLGLMRY